MSEGKKGHEVRKKLHKTKQNTCKSLNGKNEYKTLIVFQLPIKFSLLYNLKIHYCIYKIHKLLNILN
jgi:hypothetical protein